MIVIEPEHSDPVADMLFIAVLLHAREQVIEALDPVLDVLVHLLDEVLQLLSVDVVLEPRPPARLWIPDSSVRPNRLPTVSHPQLLQEQVGVGYALRVIADPEGEEDPQPGLEGYPQPGLLALDIDHRLVDED